MKLFCDMDGVIVHQIGRKRWDLMPWMKDGKQLWDGLNKFTKPTLLTQLLIDVYEISRHEKRTWVDRELGHDVECIVVHGEDGKFPHSAPGHILIDDSVAHRAPWVERGGIFILHRTAWESLTEFCRVWKD